MKTLSKLFEDQIFNVSSVSQYYRENIDLLLPAKEVLDEKDIQIAKDRILKEKEVLPKGHKYLMINEAQTLMFMVLELQGSRYHAVLTSDTESTVFQTLINWEHVEEYVKALGLDFDYFKESKL
ncbi:gp146 [Sphingomonas phage PAU]|uniref:gp146 n=1 Tax=Sphingomonas phage PAU TaxID=1150991 RepID=UPI00025732DE|nr:gp146 [Sphingomonas phage PAU]AFF28144.1 gp146 [Sphingomonas phage PAU]